MPVRKRGIPINVVGIPLVRSPCTKTNLPEASCNLIKSAKMVLLARKIESGISSGGNAAIILATSLVVTLPTVSLCTTSLPPLPLVANPSGLPIPLPLIKALSSARTIALLKSCPKIVDEAGALRSNVSVTVIKPATSLGFSSTFLKLALLSGFSSPSSIHLTVTPPSLPAV